MVMVTRSLNLQDILLIEVVTLVPCGGMPFMTVADVIDTAVFNLVLAMVSLVMNIGNVARILTRATTTLTAVRAKFLSTTTCSLSSRRNVLLRTLAGRYLTVIVVMRSFVRSGANLLMSRKCRAAISRTLLTVNTVAVVATTLVSNVWPWNILKLSSGLPEWSRCSANRILLTVVMIAVFVMTV